MSTREGNGLVDDDNTDIMIYFRPIHVEKNGQLTK